MPHPLIVSRCWARSHDRGWEVRDQRGERVRVTVYERGAVEVARRLAA